MKDKSRYWIIVGLHAQGGKCDDITGLFYSPNRPFHLAISTFLSYVKELEEKGYIKRIEKIISPAYSLTDKGNIELARFYQENKKMFFSTLKLFPNLELRDRIENIESFLTGTVLVILSAILYYKVINFTNFYLKPILLIMAFFIFVIGFAISLSFLFAIVLHTLEKTNIWFLRRLLVSIRGKENKISNLVSFLAIVLIAIILLWALDFDIKTTISTIALPLIGYLVYTRKKIRLVIIKFLNKITSKTKGD